MPGGHAPHQLPHDYYDAPANLHGSRPAYFETVYVDACSGFKTAFRCPSNSRFNSSFRA